LEILKILSVFKIMSKNELNVISSLQNEIRSKDEIIEKATKIIETLQKELDSSQRKNEETKKNAKKSFHELSKNEGSMESLNKKLQVPRSLRMNFKENFKTTKIIEECWEKEKVEIEKKCDFLEKKLKTELESKEKIQFSFRETSKKLEFCENMLKNVIFREKEFFKLLSLRKNWKSKDLLKKKGCRWTILPKTFNF